MKHYPIFLAVEGRNILLSGGGEAAIAKLRLLLKTEAKLHVYATDPATEIVNWAADGRLKLNARDLRAGDLQDAAIVYAANDDHVKDNRVAEIARASGVLVNVVDDLHGSDFITPAIVDRDPVTVAIGTEGAAPVLARAIKADLEERLPPSLGVLARAGKAFRKMADSLPKGRARRAFWSDYYFRTGPQAFGKSGESGLLETLKELLTSHKSRAAEPGRVTFVGAGPGDPELLTLKARKALDDADVVVYDRLITPEILELARREATLVDVGKTGFGPSTPQEVINELMVEHARAGKHVVRLKSGDATVFGRLDEEIDACTADAIAFDIVPGITSASAAVASIGQSLTRRGRNSSVRLMTGHDIKGFAEHDWRTLAAPGKVAAIYMGKKSARFLQGRLMMFGAAPDTPVTVVENVSRADQRILASHLSDLPSNLADADLTGPALILYGLRPREAAQTLNHLKEAVS